jgi:hypothetical protein
MPGARPTTSTESAERDASLGGAVLSAIPDFLVAGLFVWTWVRPMAFYPLMVRRLTILTLLEFVVVHSAGFCGVVALSSLPAPRKVLALVGLGSIYMLFAWGFALSADSNWPLVAFFGLMLNRLLGVLVGATPSAARVRYLGACWVGGAAFYLFGIFASVLLPVPALGITPDVVAAQHFDGGGIFPEQPYRAIAFGALYFTLIGVFEIVAARVALRSVGSGARARGA